MKRNLIIIIGLLSITNFAYSQAILTEKEHLSSMQGEHFVGIGFGLPYGALGVRLSTNIIDHLNVFGGVGFFVTGVGYNFGLRKDFLSYKRTQLYITGMYGTHGAIDVGSIEGYDSRYYGPSFGAGVKFHSRRSIGNYWDFGVLYAVKSSRYKNDLERAKNDPRIPHANRANPFLLVLGYNIQIGKPK